MDSTIAKLDGYTWFSAVCSGAKNVILQHKQLNKINVFPVADGDTGNNLSSLMQSILQYSTPDKSFYQTAQSIAQASLNGARGNSGTIFAQFFQGLIPKNQQTEEITTTDFAAQIGRATQLAKSAVVNPVLGTILTVMEDWGKACQEIKQKAKGCQDLFQSSLDPAKKSLESTKQYLEVLRKADVVDAGAQGFVYFLEGICNYFSNPKNYTDIIKDIHFEDLSLDVEDIHAVDTAPTFRYCTEVMLSDLSCSIDELKKSVLSLGDSLVVAGSEAKCRLHIHTDRPDLLVQTTSSLGDIRYQKAEDMLRQYQMTQHLTSDIALVVDSSADLPQSLIDQYQIYSVPFTIQLKGQEYLDRLTIYTEAIYKEMIASEQKVMTAQPNVALIESLFKQLSRYYKKVIVITITSKQSGCYQVFKTTAERYKDLQIEVVDSCLNGVGHGLLVKHAAEMIQAKANISTIVNNLEEIRRRINIYAVVNDLKYMVRSGRLSVRKSKIIRFLGIRPVISVDKTGQAFVEKKVFGFDNGVRHIVQLFKKEKDNIAAYAIHHGETPELAEQLAQELTKIVGFPPLYSMVVSATVGVHVGPGSIGIAIEKKKAD